MKARYFHITEEFLYFYALLIDLIILITLKQQQKHLQHHIILCMVCDIGAVFVSYACASTCLQTTICTGHSALCCICLLQIFMATRQRERDHQRLKG